MYHNHPDDPIHGQRVPQVTKDKIYYDLQHGGTVDEIYQELKAPKSAEDIPEKPIVPKYIFDMKRRYFPKHHLRGKGNLV